MHLDWTAMPLMKPVKYAGGIYFQIWHPLTYPTNVAAQAWASEWTSKQTGNPTSSLDARPGSWGCFAFHWGCFSEACSLSQGRCWTLNFLRDFGLGTDRSRGLPGRGCNLRLYLSKHTACFSSFLSLNLWSHQMSVCIILYDAGALRDPFRFGGRCWNCVSHANPNGAISLYSGIALWFP